MPRARIGAGRLAGCGGGGARWWRMNGTQRARKRTGAEDGAVTPNPVQALEMELRQPPATLAMKRPSETAPGEFWEDAVLYADPVRCLAVSESPPRVLSRASPICGQPRESPRQHVPQIAGRSACLWDSVGSHEQLSALPTEILEEIFSCCGISGSALPASCCHCSRFLGSSEG